MNIYNVQFDKAPTRQAIQLKMMKEESQGKKGRGVTVWLSMGMKAQEKQLELCEVSKQLQGKRMLSDRLKLEEKRQALQRQIEAFEAKALGVLPGIDEEDGGHDMYRGNDWMDEEDNDELDAELVDDEKGEDGDEEVEAKPEESCLSLPSQLGASAIERRGWGHITEVELQLWQGQANNALHEIRVAIRHKSFLFQNRVRPFNSQQTKTRTWGEVQVVAKMVARHAWVYTQARRAMEWLGANGDILAKYKVLKPQDLKAITHIMDNTVQGMCDQPMSWIWTVDVAGDTSQSDWLAELQWVNWLRTKARNDRWKEEHAIVLAEMNWTVRYFEKRVRDWQEIADGTAQ
ncbi:hypothetical protein WOLCODRAFT_151882 [Wolfiporia cocos MD-104 SS10]|uniref:Uncharacterized protein n=1 Tax=Wolfiporia cocos (strain MD-104) TaxID=742152 RepID=A0A2H3JSQ4_WOLCO|nr:hypothetical protein WOLCODRAFT_151882 [Wolfiporia cocos MD-104 SS10]